MNIWKKNIWKKQNNMLVWELIQSSKTIYNKIIPSFFEGLDNTKKTIGIELKFILGKPKHIEDFYQDFKNKYDEVKPLAEKIYDRMNGFTSERQKIEKKIHESKISEHEKKEYLQDIAKVYDLTERSLIPIPYRLQKMEENIKNMEKTDKDNSNYTSRKDNRLSFYRAYSDVKKAMIVYRAMSECMGDIENLINVLDNLIDNQ